MVMNAPDSIRHGLDQHSAATFDAAPPSFPRRAQYSKNIVSIYPYRLYAVTWPARSFVNTKDKQIRNNSKG